MRCVAMLLIAACTRAPSADHDLDAALDCAVAKLADAANRDLELVPLIADTTRIGAPRTPGLRVLRALAHALSAPKDLTRIAVTLAKAGDLVEARKTAEAALVRGPTPADRELVIGQAAFVLAWAGDEARAEQLAADDGELWLAVARGAARAGNRAEVDRVLAGVQAPDAASDIVRSTRIDALGCLGRISDAEHELAGEPDPMVRFYQRVLLADDALRAHLPETAALLQAAVADGETLSKDPARSKEPGLLAQRGQLAIDLDEHGDHAAASALRASIAAVLEPDDGEGFGTLAYSAALAHATREADAMLARGGTGVRVDVRAVVAGLGGDFKTATSLAAHVQPDTLLYLWELHAAHPDPQTAATFRAAVCTKDKP